VSGGTPFLPPWYPVTPGPGGDPGDPPGRPSVHDRLFDQRVVFLWGPLDDATAGRLAAELMTLDATGDDPVHLHIDSPGGSLEAAFSLIDVIDLLGVDVVATCVGQAAGTALGPLAVAHRRRATPHARFRLCEPVAETTGSARQLEAWAAAQAAHLRRFCERLGRAVGRTPEAVAADLAGGAFLDPAGARSYGLIDEICAPGGRVVPMPGAPLGFRARR